MQKVLILFLVILYLSCSEKQANESPVPAASFSLFDTDSVKYSLTDYNGRIVMIHFWADWCGSCRKEFPKIQQAYDKLKGENFEILSVNTGQSVQHIKNIRDTYNLTFPLLVDEEKTIAALYGVTGLPASYFINKNGQIVQKVLGWIETEKVIEIVRKISNNKI